MDQVRFDKGEKLRKMKRAPYAAKFDRTHSLSEAKASPDGTTVRIAGRVMLHRDMGKITFATLQDASGQLQIAFRTESVGKDEYALMLETLDLADIIGIVGVAQLKLE
jgi:lysyl-tRNA synthetase class 2